MSLSVSLLVPLSVSLSSWVQSKPFRLNQDQSTNTPALSIESKQGYTHPCGAAKGEGGGERLVASEVLPTRALHTRAMQKGRCRSRDDEVAVVAAAAQAAVAAAAVHHVHI
jgi:hypothetical protein